MLWRKAQQEKEDRSPTEACLCGGMLKERWSGEDLDEKAMFECRLEGGRKASHAVILARAKALGQEFGVSWESRETNVVTGERVSLRRVVRVEVSESGAKCCRAL